MQTLKNKAFRVSIQWNALVRKLLSLKRGTLTIKRSLKKHFLKVREWLKSLKLKRNESLRAKLQTL